MERGIAPEKITATMFTDDDTAKPVQRTRRLCPCPTLTKYKGSGSTGDAANFSCAPP